MDIEELFAELDAIGGLPESGESTERALSAFERVDRGEVVRHLVERYGAITSPSIVQPLYFQLARWAGRRPDVGTVGPHILRAVELRQIDHDVAYQNLLTAVELASAYEDIVPSGEPTASSLMRFLSECVGRDFAGETIIQAVCALHARGVFEHASLEDVRALRARLKAIQPEPNSFLTHRLSAGYLDEFFVDPRYAD